MTGDETFAAIIRVCAAAVHLVAIDVSHDSIVWTAAFDDLTGLVARLEALNPVAYAELLGAN